MRILTEQQEVDLKNALSDAQTFALGEASRTSDPNAAATFRSRAHIYRDLARLLAASHAIAVSEPERDPPPREP
ncbi:MAG TPA: hypothetical protein VF760_05215, partial [Xanthobacteraceae bacterium]